MSSRQHALLALALVPALFLSGCLVAPVSLSPSTIPLLPGGYTETGPASGSAYAVMIFGIPLSEPNPTGRARDRALESASADALVNVACDAYTVNLVILPVVIVITNVTGTAVKVN